MYIIRDKKSKEIKCIDRRAKDAKNKAKVIYPEFDGKTMEFGYTDEDYLPADFHIDKNGKVLEWTLEEKVKAGLPELGPHEKLVNGKIVEKTLTELVKEEQLTLDEIREERIIYYSNLSFDLREELVPDYRLENAALGIYDEQRTADYRATVLAFKQEFQRLRGLIEEAKKPSDIEKIKEDFPTEIVKAKL